MASNSGKTAITQAAVQIGGFLAVAAAGYACKKIANKVASSIAERETETKSETQPKPIAVPSPLIKPTPKSVNTTACVPTQKVSVIQYRSNPSNTKPTGSADEYIRELNRLIGLKNAKKLIGSKLSAIKYDRRREKAGIAITQPTPLHLVLHGNPGTGKTTVARIIGKIYKSLGLISPNGEFVEADRSKLIGNYLGQTPSVAARVVDRARGGILFIDEAYTLSVNRYEHDYGSEAVEVIMKEMEDNYKNFVVIVAGYTDKMSQFMSINPGLASRFGLSGSSEDIMSSLMKDQIHFEDYTSTELSDIFKLMAHDEHYIVPNDVEDVLQSYFRRVCSSKGENFGNARDVRNFFNRCKTNLASRIGNIPETTLLSRQELVTFHRADLVVT